jgi:hypothetical protein
MLAANRAVLRQLECPRVLSATDAEKPLALSSLDTPRFLASKNARACCVTHLCRQLQIRASEHRRQRTCEIVSILRANSQTMKSAITS